MNISKYKSKSIIGDIYVNIYIIFSLLYQQQMLGGESQSKIILVSIPIFLYLLMKMKRTIKTGEFKFVLFILFVIIFIILNSLIIRGELLTGAIISSLITSSVAYIIYSKNIYYKSVYLIPFIFFFSYISVRINEVILPELVFANSKNYISFVLIVSIIPYYFILFKDGIYNAPKNISYLPAIITFLLSVYALGRSGVVASFLIVVGILIYWSYGNRVKQFYLVLITSSLILTFIYYLISINDYQELERFSHMQDGGRAEIISNVFTNNNLQNYILGFNPNDLNAYSKYGHLHSSILNFYSVIGVMALFYFICVGIFMLKSFNSYNYVLMIIYLALYLRLSTDVGIGFSFMDYLLWFPILKVIDKK